MDFMRRFASPESPEHGPSSLTVDTSVTKDLKSSVHASEARSPQWTPSSARGSASPPAHEDAERLMRRRRSHSECLFLAKNQGTANLPGPCQEYISNVKQILAKNEDLQMQLKRRRSMSLRVHSPLAK